MGRSIRNTSKIRRDDMRNRYRLYSKRFTLRWHTSCSICTTTFTPRCRGGGERQRIGNMKIASNIVQNLELVRERVMDLTYRLWQPDYDWFMHLDLYAFVHRVMGVRACFWKRKLLVNGLAEVMSLDVPAVVSWPAETNPLQLKLLKGYWSSTVTWSCTQVSSILSKFSFL